MKNIKLVVGPVVLLVLIVVVSVFYYFILNKKESSEEFTILRTKELKPTPQDVYEEQMVKLKEEWGNNSNEIFNKRVSKEEAEKMSFKDCVNKGFPVVKIPQELCFIGLEPDPESPKREPSYDLIVGEYERPSDFESCIEMGFPTYYIGKGIVCTDPNKTNDFSESVIPFYGKGKEYVEGATIEHKQLGYRYKLPDISNSSVYLRNGPDFFYDIRLSNEPDNVARMYSSFQYNPWISENFKKRFEKSEFAGLSSTGKISEGTIKGKRFMISEITNNKAYGRDEIMTIKSFTVELRENVLLSIIYQGGKDWHGIENFDETIKSFEII
jgi:hypothetical protein